MLLKALKHKVISLVSEGATIEVVSFVEVS